MTRDKAGHPCFIKGKEYKPRTTQNPVWSRGTISKCLETKDWQYGADDGTLVTVKDGMGLFTNGADSRWWAATEQIDEA